MFRIAFCFLRLLAFTSIAAGATDLDREIILTPQNGTSAEDIAIVRWQTRAGASTVRVEDFERLGWAYVAKARRTLDAGYYKLAEKTTDVAEAQFGSRPELSLLRGYWFLHHRWNQRLSQLLALAVIHRAQRFEERGFVVGKRAQQRVSS